MVVTYHPDLDGQAPEQHRADTARIAADIARGANAY
jgi:hypothetical protein